MSKHVSVESFEALKGLRVALCKFADEVSAGLYEADAELQRARNWVKSQQTSYWKMESQKRAEQLVRAKSELSYKKMRPSALGSKPSCVDEQEAVELAMRRVQEAERKSENVRQWSRRLDEEAVTYQTVAGGMSQALTIDVPKAVAHLDHMLAALEAYAISAAPQFQASIVEPLDAPTRDAVSSTDSVMSEYANLRSATPAESVRDLILPASWHENPRRSGGNATNWVKEIDALGLTLEPPSPGDKVLLLRGAIQQDQIYLERSAQFPAGDSGWYIGTMTQIAATGYQAVSVHDVLTVRPELAPLLNLPNGFLIVVDGQTIRAVLNRTNHQICPATGTKQ